MLGKYTLQRSKFQVHDGQESELGVGRVFVDEGE